MAGGQLNAEALSGRQLAVAVVVAGLSPAAALAGAADWVWILAWTGAGCLLTWFVLRRLGGCPVFRGVWGRIIYIMYAGWSVLLAARVLDRAAQRMELTSGGSPRFWLLLIFAIPLLWVSWGKAAPFFRMIEILWLAMAAVLALVLVFGVVRVEWSYAAESQEDWLKSALAMGEIFSPALFVLPYLYKVKEHSNRRAIAWLSVMGMAAAGMSLITVGMLGTAADRVPLAFYVAAGTLGGSARCEGLLAVLWLLPDLTMVGLLCRVWGGRRWPAAGVVLAAGLAIVGVGDRISSEICVCGTLILLLLSLFLPRGKGKIVVGF